MSTLDKYLNSSLAAKCMLVAFAISFMCASTLLGEYAWRVSEYNPSLILFAAEMLKLIISAHFYRNECIEQEMTSKLFKPLTTEFWYDAQMFAVPAFLYFVLNNANMIALKYLSSHLVTMIANFKLVMVAGLAVTYFKQPISNVQWFAVTMVCVGMAVTLGNPGMKSQNRGNVDGSVAPAVAYGVVSAAISSVAGGVTEMLYKKGNDTVHIQNVKMYTFGVLFNSLSIVLYGTNNTCVFTHLHALLIVLFALSGLSMGLIMKYINNVVRGVAVSLGSVISTGVSVALLGNELTGNFLVGGSIVVISAHMHTAFPATHADKNIEVGSKVVPHLQVPWMHLVVLAPLVLLFIAGYVPILDLYLHQMFPA